MSFGEQLNKYIQILNCNSKDISRVSGLSPAIISRYLNGKRTPKLNSTYFSRIVDAIYSISIQKKVNLKKENIYNELASSISTAEINYDIFISNFNTLLIELKFNLSDLATSIGYDTSFISRIKNKDRKPADLESFIDKLCEYVVENYKNENDLQTVAAVIKCSTVDLKDESSYKKIFINWITSYRESKNGIIKDFLTSLDNFNLNDYIGTDFSKVKVPTSPVIFKSSKTLFGSEGRKQAEGEFLKTTLLSKSKESIFFYNDFPISEAGKDEDFKKKWILAITMLLKKGLHLNIVHNINRPIDEMLLGLQSWIPVYMTGSISPFYFKNPPSNLFNVAHCTSGSVALSSECINNNEHESRFYITTKKDELVYEKKKSEYLLSIAKPLMEIYKEADAKRYNEFIGTFKNDKIETIEESTFKNIDFSINKGKWVIINKKNSPEMHFVIFHEKLRKPIENFILEEQ